MAGNKLVKHIIPPKILRGEIQLPGDKSISHRAMILSSIALGSSKISNLSTAKDCYSTMNCLKALGIKYTRQANDPTKLEVHGNGIDGICEAKNILYAGNSGTTMRLLAGVLATRPFLSVLNGDASLRTRPMKRIIEPLRSMGAEIFGRGNDSFAPLVVKGGKLHGIDYKLPVPSAQIKSSILLSGLCADSETVIEGSHFSRDHTERLLKLMGAELEYENDSIRLTPLESSLIPIDIEIPGDISSASYWLVAGAIHQNARIKIVNCGINPTRTGIIDVLLSMGAKLTTSNMRIEGSEPVADLIIESSQLKATEISEDIVPRLIDEIPVLVVAACMADGVTIIRGANELRVKESDRITSTVRELSKLGAKIEELPDGMVVHGGEILSGAVVKSHFDHRLAMSLAIVGLVAVGETIVSDAQAVDISYPGFWKILEELGAGYDEENNKSKK
jgi:3-phosphoshikimate 1-carboxyvinyltransferase